MFVTLEDQEIELLAAINSGRATSTVLASRLRVSRPTVARILASLRKKGVRVSSRRTGHGWFYELNPLMDPQLDRIVGMLDHDPSSRNLKPHDEELIRYLNSKSKKASSKVKAASR